MYNVYTQQVRNSKRTYKRGQNFSRKRAYVYGTAARATLSRARRTRYDGGQKGLHGATGKICRKSAAAAAAAALSPVGPHGACRSPRYPRRILAPPPPPRPPVGRPRICSLSLSLSLGRPRFRRTPVPFIADRPRLAK